VIKRERERERERERVARLEEIHGLHSCRSCVQIDPLVGLMRTFEVLSTVRHTTAAAAAATATTAR